MPASVELVKIALRAYADGYSEIAVALCAPEIVWDERASRPDAELVRSRSEVEREMRRYLGGWGEHRFELEDVAEVSPGVVAGICRERGDADGEPVDRRFGAVWTVEAAKIASWRTYRTPREAVRAAKSLDRGPERARREGRESAEEPARAMRATGEPSAPKEGAEKTRGAPAVVGSVADATVAPRLASSPGPAGDERKRRAARARARLQRQRAAS